MGREVVKAVTEAAGMCVAGAADKLNVGEDIGKIVLGTKSGVIIKESLKEVIETNKIDVVVDFTEPDSVYKNARIILNAGVRPVIGTTGLSDLQVNDLERLSEEKSIGMLIAPNFAIGAVLMMMFAKTAAKYFDNAEIIELHHNKKKDAPSGTAVKTAQMMASVKKEFAKDNIAEIELINGSRGGTTESNIHIHSVRMPGYIASQEVLFGSQGQVLKIRHDSIDRTCFMPGVILSVRHVVTNNDFVYGLENIL
jgi:4-hydroxy-tetrahydrodipicolinate reductase